MLPRSWVSTSVSGTTFKTVDATAISIAIKKNARAIYLALLVAASQPPRTDFGVSQLLRGLGGRDLGLGQTALPTTKYKKKKKKKIGNTRKNNSKIYIDEDTWSAAPAVGANPVLRYRRTSRASAVEYVSIEQKHHT
jgi:hypothetical protein